MKYTKTERLNIGKEICNHEIDAYEAAEKYGINYFTARDYMRMYKSAHNFKNTNNKKDNHLDLNSMSKEELIEVINKLNNKLEKIENICKRK